MKKSYIVPTVFLQEVEMDNLLAASDGLMIYDRLGGVQLSKEHDHWEDFDDWSSDNTDDAIAPYDVNYFRR